MKSTGVVRKVDELGRIVIPIEVRKVFDIYEKDPMEIYVDEDRIVLKKRMVACSTCGCDDAEKLKLFKGKYFCKDCIKKMSEIL